MPPITLTNAGRQMNLTIYKTGPSQLLAVSDVDIVLTKVNVEEGSMVYLGLFKKSKAEKID